MNNLRNDLHMTKRRNKAIAAVHSLKQLGFNSIWMHPLIKAQLYKTFIRPILYYGLENFKLNIGESGKVQRLEPTLLKNMLGITKYCESTELLLAFNINSFQNRIRILKFNYLNRLITNKYTKMVLETQLEILKTVRFQEKENNTTNNFMNLMLENSSTNERLKMDYAEMTLKKLNKNCALKRREIETANKYLIKYNKKIEDINFILKNENSFECRMNLQNLLLPEKMKEFFKKFEEENRLEKDLEEIEPPIDYADEYT